jgi:2-oxo-3-hexenedioate decarboxylase
VTVAEELVEARRRRECVVAPTKRDNGFSLSDGYAVADEVAKLWQDAGHRVAGIKIGLTNTALWERLGITAPVWGPIYRDVLLDATAAGADPVVFPLGALTAPRIEAEIVVELSAELGPGADLDTIARSIAWAALGFEFVDCHYENWELQPPDLVADFCAHAGLVIGPPAVRTPAELLALDAFPIELHSDGSVVCTGSGDRVAGGPLRAIAAVLAAPDAPVLPAGALVMTGALTGGAHPVVAAQGWRIAPGRQSFAPVAVRTVA